MGAEGLHLNPGCGSVREMAVCLILGVVSRVDHRFLHAVFQKTPPRVSYETCCQSSTS